MSIGESIRGLFHKKNAETRSSTAHVDKEEKIFLNDKAKKFGESVQHHVKTANQYAKKY